MREILQKSLIAFEAFFVVGTIMFSVHCDLGDHLVKSYRYLAQCISLKYAVHSFISSSLSVGDSLFHLFTKLTVFRVDFSKISLMIEYTLLDWLRWSASSACKHLFSRKCWWSFSKDSSVNFSTSFQLS